MFRQHWQTMLNECCLNGPVSTGFVSIISISIAKMVMKIRMQYVLYNQLHCGLEMNCQVKTRF